MTKKVSQDPDAHVFYDVDWILWLKARGFLVDGSEIVSVAFNVPAPLVKTHELLTGALARVWIKNVIAGKEFDINCTITLPEPNAGAGVVKDDFTFTLRGLNR